MSKAIGVVSAAAVYALDAILVRPKRSIGPFIAQVTLEESGEDELEITEHPVEQGAAIADHAYKRPARLRIKCAWSSSPSTQGVVNGIVGGILATPVGVQSRITQNNVSSVRDTYAKLLQLQQERVPFKVFTGKRVYDNMLIQSLTQTTDPTSENSLQITASFRQVIIVKTTTLAAGAPAKNQIQADATQSPTNTGNQVLKPSAEFNPAGGGRGFSINGDY